MLGEVKTGEEAKEQAQVPVLCDLSLLPCSQKSSFQAGSSSGPWWGQAWERGAPSDLDLLF
jgi:hypothetical protein